MSSNRHTWLTVPEMHRLSTACVSLCEVYGRPPYLVGSATERRDYRDVDVRLILDDDDFARRFPDRHSLLLINAVMSDHLARQTGLPIDFQFQPWAENLTHDGKALPLGIKEALWPDKTSEN